MTATNYAAGFANLTDWNLCVGITVMQKFFSDSALFKLFHESTCKIYLANE